MTFKELRAALLREHMAIYTPFDKLPADGWQVIVWPSEFHPQGWSLRITHPHRIINAVVAGSFERVGFAVQWSDNDGRMEAWPKGGAVTHER